MAASITDLETPGTLTCTIQAPADEVFMHWIDPHLICRWVAPLSYRVKQAEVDARVGGRYRIAVVGPAGDVHVMTGRYLDLVPGRRLVKTWAYEGPLASPGSPESIITVELREAHPGVTELTMRRSR